MEPIVRLFVFSEYQAAICADQAFLYFVPYGSLQITREGKKEILKNRDLFVCNPMENHEVLLVEGMLVRIDLSSELLSLGLDKNDRRYIQCSSLAENTIAIDHLREIVMRLMDAKIQQSEASLGFMRLGCELCEYLFQYFSFNTRYQSEIQSRAEQFQAYLETNYKNEVTLQEAADAFGLSAPYFSKVFKDETGMSFVKALAAYRCRMSLPLLLHSKEGILQIALECGFPNVNAYINSFKEHYNKTPSQYRKLHKPDVSITEADQKQTREFLDTYNQKQLPVSIEITSRLDHSKPLDPFWFSLYNLGSCSWLSKTDSLQTAQTILQKLPFKQARALLDLPADSDQADFYGEERVLDMLVDMKITPWIVLSFRDWVQAGKNQAESLYGLQNPKKKKTDPSARFSSQNDPFSQDIPGRKIPSSQEEIRVFFAGCLDWFSRFLHYFRMRYGMENIQGWNFELHYNSDFLEEESRLYDPLCALLNERLAACGIRQKTAGPGLQQDYEGNNLKRFLSMNTQIDHVCITLSPISFDSKEGLVYMNRKTSPDSFLDDYRKAKTIASAYGIYKITPVEWMDSVYEQDLLNETCWKAARLVQACFYGYGRLPALPLSMPGHNQERNPGFFEGDPGLLTNRNIPKPAWHALTFLKHLDNQLAFVNEHCIISCSSSRYIQIVLHNCSPLSYQYYLDEGRQNPEALPSWFEKKEDFTILLHLQDLDNGRYVIKEKRVGVEEGNAYSRWRNMNFPSPSFVGPNEIAYLQASAIPPVTGSSILVEQGTADLTCTLKPNEIRHLHLIFESSL